MLSPEKIFKHVEVMTIETGESAIDIIKEGMLNNFYLSSGCEDFEDIEESVDAHKEYHDALDKYGKVFGWKAIDPKDLASYSYGCIFRAFGEDGFENVYMIIANDKENLLWVPVSRTNTPMCEVHRWDNGWMSIGYFRLEDIADIMEMNAVEGHFYKVTSVNGTPMDILGDDDDYEFNVSEQFEGVYQAIKVDDEIEFISAAFVLNNEKHFAGLSKEWAQLIEEIVGENPYEDDVDEDESFDAFEKPVPENIDLPKSTPILDMAAGEDMDGDEETPNDYDAASKATPSIEDQLDSLFK